MITHQVYPPGCCANPRSDKWRCEVRNGGFIADWNLFDTEKEAEDWGANHNGKIGQSAADAITSMLKRYENK